MGLLLEGFLRSLGDSEANFLEVCFGRIPCGYVHTKANSKKSRLVNLCAFYRGQVPQDRENRVSGLKNSSFPAPPISQCPRRFRFESKNRHFSTGHHNENGDLLIQSVLCWGA